MFSKEERCILSKPPLSEVVCQFNFPDILIIGSTSPAQFQEAIRSEFPVYRCHAAKMLPKNIVPNQAVLQNQPVTNVHVFTAADNTWALHLGTNFLRLSCRNYSCWEDFAHILDKPLAAFIRIYKPAHFTRVGLRYINFISRKLLNLEGTPFSEMIMPCYLGPLMEEDVLEPTVSKCSVDVELSLRGGCKAKIHAGPGLTKQGAKADPEVKFIFDQDLYMLGNVPVNVSAGALQTLHAQAYGIFRGAVTDMLFDAMNS